MAQKIQVRRGLALQLPILSVGEIGFCTDTKELFVGSDSGNQLLAKKSDITNDSEKVIIEKSSTNGEIIVDGVPLKIYDDVLLLESLGNKIDVNYLEEVLMGKADKIDIHLHSNKAILDATEESYTISEKEKVNDSSKQIIDAKGEYLTLKEKIDNIIINGGGTPSNVILFDDWIDGEAVMISVDIPTETIGVTFTPNGGSFLNDQVVTINANKPSEIWYTVDGSDPILSESPIQYTAPITISVDTTIRAFAIDASGNKSNIGIATFTKQPENGYTGVSDSFNREDSDTLGIADTGQSWITFKGEWGIENFTAKSRTNTASSATAIESGLSDCTVTVKASVYSGANRIVFRAKDYNNYLYIYNKTINKLVNGVVTKIADFNPAFAGANGDIFKIILNGSSITVIVNGVEHAQLTESAFQTETKHGFGGNTIQYAIFDDFKVEPINL